MTADDLLSRIDSLLDDEETDDFPWLDSWRWAPSSTELPEGVWEESDDESLDGGWEVTGDCQIHAIPAEQVGEWTAWLETLEPGERGEIAWYVVCFEHGVAGEREVACWVRVMWRGARIHMSYPRAEPGECRVFAERALIRMGVPSVDCRQWVP